MHITRPIRRALDSGHGPQLGTPTAPTARVWMRYPIDIQPTSKGTLVHTPGMFSFYQHPELPHLSVGQFRDPLARAGGPAGRLLRSARLYGSSKWDQAVLRALLHNGEVLDLRTSGRASREPDPRIRGVAAVAIPLPPTKYVPYDEMITGYGPQLGEVLHHLALSTGPVLVHCTEGKDRTGIVIALVMLAARYSLDTALDEFLSTEGARVEDWSRLMMALLESGVGTDLLGPNSFVEPEVVWNLRARYGIR